jgi:hypothetical protein
MTGHAFGMYSAQETIKPYQKRKRKRKLKILKILTA